MTLDELAPWLFARVSGGIRWGLERTERLLAGAGDPHRHFDSVLIGGTNGKGSVAALCESALCAGGGRRIGLYTSPHLVSLTERIRVDGRAIDAERLASVAERLKPAIEATGATFFESTTAMAFLAFAEAGVELAVVEVGLGGRLDATNVLRPLVTGVTNVALDHTEYLGETIEEVAAEKAGIYKRGIPALSGEGPGVAADVLARQATAAGAIHHWLDDLVEVRDVRVGLDGTRCRLVSRRWGERETRVRLVGHHQARNAAFAAELLGLLPDGSRPDWESVRAGFAAVRWPGRVQVETIRGTTWVFDVAHNPSGARVLADTLAELPLARPIVAVVGILRDKDWRTMIPAFTDAADALILTVPPTAPEGRRWDAAEAERWARGVSGVPVRTVADFDAALARATTLAPHGTVVVTGSVHTVGDALVALGAPIG